MAITYSIARQEYGLTEYGANPDCGQLTRERLFFPCLCSHLRNWSRETGSDVPSRVSLLILYTQPEYGAY